MSLPLPEYESYDAVGLAELVRRGEVSASELLDAAVARAAERNPTLNAVVIDLEKEARSAIAAGLPEGPLTGVPFLLKGGHSPSLGESRRDGLPGHFGQQRMGMVGPQASHSSGSADGRRPCIEWE